GATSGERFLAYVTDTLVSVLKRSNTVILDNLSVHKVTGVRKAVEAAGARLLYRPNFNPIEQAFAKLKALLRTVAARAVPDLWAAIRQDVAAFQPNECRNYVDAVACDAFDPT
ncbi:transposase, partial [Methylobacterium sp. WL93]|uniref:transposase n=1 Tax=Methylobacterium sp. WL93 TaxID=2603892 RepID=UPI001FEF3B9C